jgi:hypothetical protein
MKNKIKHLISIITAAAVIAASLMMPAYGVEAEVIPQEKRFDGLRLVWAFPFIDTNANPDSSGTVTLELPDLDEFEFIDTQIYGVDLDEEYFAPSAGGELDEPTGVLTYYGTELTEPFAAIKKDVFDSDEFVSIVPNNGVLVINYTPGSSAVTSGEAEVSGNTASFPRYDRLYILVEARSEISYSQLDFMMLIGNMGSDVLQLTITYSGGAFGGGKQTTASGVPVPLESIDDESVPGGDDDDNNNNNTTVVTAEPGGDDTDNANIDNTPDNADYSNNSGGNPTEQNNYYNNYSNNNSNYNSNNNSNYNTNYNNNTILGGVFQ